MDLVFPVIEAFEIETDIWKMVQIFKKFDQNTKAVSYKPILKVYLTY